MSYLSLYPSPTVTGYGLNPATSPRFAEEKQKYQEWLAQTIQAVSATRRSRPRRVKSGR